MLFGQKTISVEAFLPRVLSHIDGINSEMVQSYIVDAIIQFVREAQIMTEIVCVTLDPCIDSYKIPTTYRLVEVLHARLFVNGHQRPIHRFDYRVEGDTLYTEFTGNCGEHKVELELSVAPYRDSDEVPEFLYEEWLDPIVSLTLSKLYLLTDNEWYNPTAANNHMSIYQQHLRAARINKITKHKALALRLSNKRRL